MTHVRTSRSIQTHTVRIDFIQCFLHNYVFTDLGLSGYYATPIPTWQNVCVCVCVCGGGGGGGSLVNLSLQEPTASLYSYSLKEHTVDLSLVCIVLEIGLQPHNAQ